jgi:hypothetical protein
MVDHSLVAHIPAVVVAHILVVAADHIPEEVADHIQEVAAARSPAVAADHIPVVADHSLAARILAEAADHNLEVSFQVVGCNSEEAAALVLLHWVHTSDPPLLAVPVLVQTEDHNCNSFLKERWWYPVVHNVKRWNLSLHDKILPSYILGRQYRLDYYLLLMLANNLYPTHSTDVVQSMPQCTLLSCMDLTIELVLRW